MQTSCTFTDLAETKQDVRKKAFEQANRGQQRLAQKKLANFPIGKLEGSPSEAIYSHFTNNITRLIYLVSKPRAEQTKDIRKRAKEDTYNVLKY